MNGGILNIFNLIHVGCDWFLWKIKVIFPLELLLVKVIIYPSFNEN